MSTKLTEAIRSITKGNAHLFAALWTIKRRDGVVLRFTNHNTNIEYDGAVYEAVGGFDRTALQKPQGLKERNLDLVGMLHSDAITHDDLRAGRYRGAEVSYQLINWKFPWAGFHLYALFWVVEVRFTGESWEAQIAGLTTWLRRQVGGVYGRTCELDLGDSGCKVDLEALKVVGEVVADSKDRLSFPVQLELLREDGYFDYGRIEWISGLNDGISAEIKTYDGPLGGFILRLKMPFDIKEGDLFRAYPGCNKTLQECKDKFDNVLNHRGFPTIPGTDKMMMTPNAKG